MSKTHQIEQKIGLSGQKTKGTGHIWHLTFEKTCIKMRTQGAQNAHK